MEWSMHICLIRTDEDHETALREIEALWRMQDDTQAVDRLDVLATLVEAYERWRWPIESLNPVHAIEAVVEINGYNRAEFDALIGQSRAAEILARHHAVSLPMIRKIAGLGISLKRSWCRTMRWLKFK
jgi:HTH-type transcriptional regulator/antitoxin HigA